MYFAFFFLFIFFFFCFQDTNGAAIFVGGERGSDYKFSENLYKLGPILRNSISAENFPD
jgi:hypothetical protein